MTKFTLQRAAVLVVVADRAFALVRGVEHPRSVADVSIFPGQ